MDNIAGTVAVHQEGIPENTLVALPSQVMPPLELPPSPPGNATTVLPSHHKISPLLIAGIITFILFGATVYALVTKTDIFGSSQYTESNFASGILGKISTIESAHYALSGSLDVVPRDADAVTFIMPEGDTEDLQKKYESDVKRLGEVRMILGKLQRDVTLPDTLKEGFSDKNAGTYGPINIVDPLTQKEYEYTLSEDKKDFKISVTFETDEIIEAYKESQKSSFSARPDSTIVDGKKITFTKDSQVYGFIDTELPKPFLVEMSESMSVIPTDVKGKITVSASSELKPGSMADWAFNVDAEGYFSDMTYKVNADVLRKDDNYYFKINNFPMIALLNAAAPIKGKWIIFPINSTETAGATDTSTAGGSGVTQDQGTGLTTKNPLQEFEKIYKENRESILEFMKKITLSADQEGILIFKNTPKKETIEGRELVRYEISIRKDKIYSFIKKLSENVQKDPEFIQAFELGFGIPKTDKTAETAEEKAAQNKEIEEYLKSEEFNQIFDYIDKNNTFVIWTDANGYPAIIQNTMRIVPSDTAEQLKEKQISLVYTLAISNINEPVSITAPTDATPWDTISKEMNPYQGKIDETTIVAGLANIRTIGLDVWEKEKSYGNKGFALGPCQPTEGTFFANPDVVNVLNSLTNNDMSLATCYARGRLGKITVWALSVPIPDKPESSYCIDSSTVQQDHELTTAKLITGSIKGIVCK